MSFEQLQVAIDTAQRDIGVGELAVQAEAHVLEQRRLRLSIGRAGLDRVVHAAPEVDLVARLCEQLVVAVIVRLGGGQACGRCGAPTACCPTASSAG